MTTAEEQQLTKAGFVLVVRNIARGESLWERDDTPNRSFLDSEALQWLDERQPTKGKKKQVSNG